MVNVKPYRDYHGKPISEEDVIEWIADWDEGRFDTLELADFTPLTEKICEAAIRRYSAIFEEVPEELKSRNICHLAMRHSGDLLYLVPVKHRDFAVCQRAARSCMYKAVLGDMPIEHLTADVCLSAVHNVPNNLQFVPPALRTLDLCLRAVRKNNECMDFVPEELRLQVEETIVEERRKAILH